MNYKVNYDRTYTNISGTNEDEIDGEIFKKYSDAKRAALEYLKEEISGLKYCIKEIKSVKAADIKSESNE